MTGLPFKAKIFLGLIVSLGIVCTLAGLLPIWPHAVTPWFEPVLFVLLAIFAGMKKIGLTVRKPDNEASKISLAFALTFAVMLRSGMVWALVVGITGALAGCLYPRRQAFYQIAFNVAETAVDVCAANLVFLALNGWTLKLTLPQSIVAVSLAVVANFLINTGLVATIIGLCTDRSPIDVWNEHFLITAPTHFYGAAVGAIAIYILGSNAAVVLIAAAPIAFFTYLSYTAAAQREAEKQKYLEDLHQSQRQLAGLYLATIKSLALAIEAKDRYTHQHILRVQRYANAIAKQLKLSQADLDGINTGALLHDIGKLGVPEHILLKPGRLTREEFDQVKRHPEIGAAILDPVEFPWPVLPVVKYHHEKWDGTGYPEGLKGEEIPFTARVLAVADVYDALTSNRSYRNAWSHERAVDEIRRTVDAHFDAVVVDAFLNVIDAVVAEMAAEGIGPLAPKSAAAPSEAGDTDKAADAAKQMKRTSIEILALCEMAQTLSSNLGLEETLNLFVRKLEAIFPDADCVFMLYDDQQTLSARAAGGVNQEFFHKARVFDQRDASVQTTYNGRYEPDDLLLTAASSSPWAPLQSALIVPLVHQGRALGTINLYHALEEAFDSHAQHLLETIASWIAKPIFNGILFDQMRSSTGVDPLTGLYNERFLTEQIQERCRRISLRRQASGSPEAEKDLLPDAIALVDASRIRDADTFALLCLDIDSFRAINTNFGYQHGDRVLCDLSRIFREAARVGDVVIRYGGDEFAVLLNASNSEDASLTAERLQSAVEAYDAGLVHERLGALKLGVSVGVACYPVDGTNWETLFANAASRMYHNKTERELGRLAELPSTEERRQRIAL